MIFWLYNLIFKASSIKIELAFFIVQNSGGITMKNSPDSNGNTKKKGQNVLHWLGIVMDSGTFCHDEALDLSLLKIFQSAN